MCLLFSSLLGAVQTLQKSLWGAIKHTEKERKQCQIHLSFIIASFLSAFLVLFGGEGTFRINFLFSCDVDGLYQLGDNILRLDRIFMTSCHIIFEISRVIWMD